MKLFGAKIGAQAHDATITLGPNLAKVGKERMRNRVESIANSLKTSPDMPKAKVEKLKNEVRGILEELDARKEVIDDIISKLTKGND